VKPVEILLLVSRDPEHPLAAGGERHLWDIARELVAAGHRVTMLTAAVPGRPRETNLEGIHVVRLAPHRLLAPAMWAGLLTRYHRRFHVVIEEIIGAERVPFLGLLLSGTPTIGYWYQDNRPLFQSVYSPRLARIAGVAQGLLLRGYRGRRMLTISHDSLTWLESQGFPSDRIALATPRMKARVNPATITPFSRRSDIFVTIGNFRATKRFDEAVEVLAHLRKIRPTAELRILGRRQDDEYLHRLTERIAALQLGDSVRIMENVSDEVKYATLQSAKVLTVHSAIEGFAMTIPEAGLCGVPSVGNTGVPSDTLRDGINGYRVPFGDVAAYAAAIEKLMSDADAWSKFSAGAGAVAQEFTKPILNESVHRVLEYPGRSFWH
jgi:glycosyltransferase involved in cell wall biosynthesis